MIDLYEFLAIMDERFLPQDGASEPWHKLKLIDFDPYSPLYSNGFFYTICPWNSHSINNRVEIRYVYLDDTITNLFVYIYVNNIRLGKPVNASCVA